MSKRTLRNSQDIQKCVSSGVSDTQYYSNCWKILKLFKLQRNTLNGIGVNVTKVEKIE